MKIKVILITIISLVLVATIATCVVLTTDIFNPAVRQIKLGYKYLTEGNYEEAILAFDKAIEINPNEMASYIAMVNIHEQIEDSDKAYIYMTKMFRALVSEDADITFSNKFSKYTEQLHMKSFDGIFEDWYALALDDVDRKELLDKVKNYLLNLDNEKYSQIIERATEQYRQNKIKDLNENGFSSGCNGNNIKYRFKAPQWWSDLYETDGWMDEHYVYHKNSKAAGYGGVLFVITENEPLDGYESELLENDFGLVYYWNTPTTPQTNSDNEAEYNRMKAEVEFMKETFVIEDNSPMGRYDNGDYVTLTGKLMYVNNQGYYSLITDKEVSITFYDSTGFGATRENRFRVVTDTNLEDYNGKKVKVSGNIDGTQVGNTSNVYYSICDAIVELNE